MIPRDRPFDTILVANRGEIALRVLRSCRELGVRVVVAHSTADADSAAVRYADTTVCIGPPAAGKSYLNRAAVLEAAKRTGAQAIHPGYGFLSEHPDFAEACEAEGVVFVGPPAEVMMRLGDKVAARSSMAEAGVPMLPGTLHPVTSEQQAAEAAAEIGYPVIVKAAAGGGGRGMHVVHDPDEFSEAYRRTTATARTLFGDGRVYVERYLASARHVEVQLLCDTHGNAVHLGDRDCSVQRRHQKLVEEAPAPGLPDEVRDRMGDDVVRAALVTGYVGAGTFEFLVDDEFNHYFMEVNCRIQVEHPVTEMVTGIDLVAEQLHVAAGAALPFGQDDVRMTGTAVECRVNAEDPDSDFRPAAGLLSEFTPPGGAFVRVDTHCRPHYRIPAEYDSLLAKVAAWAPDRAGALARMHRALGEFDIAGTGVHTTTRFLRNLIGQPVFARAEHDTGLVTAILSERTQRS
ncbi:acetyl-CoA carboxylase biotin carboxylase subunit [Saccharopolyspora lacisalsi]|uniref:biotin carboxylase n=1 Tax=Halosaccharopolyspora lacisalsi TaxID=1000566 RepID=A0A839DW84_9PSEU|nr:acetyl-CoA carboxylase biotin carboxylase subunit [Halosaccharopolyspora lacisalsi]MBA8826222.1 acetyl-CoA carboxylase biotin carboxylase subunit [Halosaccharopolyspora lacisalsi]